MWSIYKKEINSLLSSYIAYIVLAVFLSFMGLFMWVFTETSILDNNYATVDQLFVVAPMIFIFLIPAITMRSFSEEDALGTMEILLTKPVRRLNILLGKYFANATLLLLALLPTLIYVYSVYQLGSPVGNIDTGAIAGSYFGLIFLGLSFTAIGTFSSALTSNQIIAFVLGAFLCFLFHWSFDFISSLPIFFGRTDNIVEALGIHQHYASMSKGLIDFRDVVYFITLIGFFLFASYYLLMRKVQ